MKQLIIPIPVLLAALAALLGLAASCTSGVAASSQENNISINTSI